MSRGIFHLRLGARRIFVLGFQPHCLNGPSRPESSLAHARREYSLVRGVIPLGFVARDGESVRLPSCIDNNRAMLFMGSAGTLARPVAPLQCAARPEHSSDAYSVGARVSGFGFLNGRILYLQMSTRNRLLAILRHSMRHADSRSVRGQHEVVFSRSGPCRHLSPSSVPEPARWGPGRPRWCTINVGSLTSSSCFFVIDRSSRKVELAGVIREANGRVRTQQRRVVCTAELESLGLTWSAV